MLDSDLKEKYRELVENANSIILRMDVNGNVTFFNEFAQRFFGYAEADILGKNVIGTIVPSTDFTGQDLTAMIKDIMVHPQKYVNNENENMTRAGRHVWVSWTNKPILDREGKLQEVLCIGNDISRLKKTELELKKAEELAEAAGRIGIIICSPDWKIKAITSAARRYFHLDVADYSGLDVLDVIFQCYQPSIGIKEIKDLSAPHQTFELTRPETAGNKALYLQINRETVRDPQQEITSIVLSVQDITGQREEELLKQDFLGLISHKLRTPITAILETSSLLQQDKAGKLKEQRSALLNILVESASRLNELVSNLLNFVMINDKNLTASKEPIPIAEYLPKLLRPMLNLVKGKKVDLQIDCQDKSLTVSMNRTYFDLMIGNLVDNAIKFNDKEEIVIKITVRKEKGATCLTVSDNGPGIAVEEQEKIFEKFYQIEKSFTGSVAGAGLGLPLVKKIVAVYGGAIDLRSELGRGTTFNIVLPA